MPATLALTHPSHHPIRAPQHCPCGCQIPSGHGAADPAAGDVLSSQIHGIHHIDLESLHLTEAAEGIHVSTPPPAEAMIVPDDELAHPAAIEQDLADELLGRESRKMAVEPEKQNVIKRELGQNFQSLWSG